MRRLCLAPRLVQREEVVDAELVVTRREGKGAALQQHEEDVDKQALVAIATDNVPVVDAIHLVVLEALDLGAVE